MAPWSQIDARRSSLASRAASYHESPGSGMVEGRLMASVPPGAPAGQPTGQDPLTLGAYTFGPLEAPNELPIGAGRSVQVVSERIGGSRVVASFGAQPYSVEWAGTLW